MRFVLKRHIVVEETELKDKVKYWIKKEMRVGNTFTWEREILKDLKDIPDSPSFPAYVRHWFAGTAPVCPLTDPRPDRRGLSTTMVRILIAAAIVEYEGDYVASKALADRACELCEQFLYEPAPFDVNELNCVLSHDDDEQIVALDASMRLEDRIRRNSPLHPLRLMLTWLQSVSFDTEAILEMLYDDDTGKTGGFPMADRFYDWARERRGALRAVARTWRARHWSLGSWQDRNLPVDDEDEEEEEEEEVVITSHAEEEEEEPFEFDIEFGEPGQGPEPVNAGAEPEPANAVVQPEPEPEDDYATRPFFIKITQMAGTKEDEKNFLLPADEEPRRLVLPQRREISAEDNDVWPQLVQMTKRLARRMEAVSKNKGSRIKNECRELAENMRLFLAAENTYND